MHIKTWQGNEVTIKVDYDLCNGSAECVDSCPSSVYALQAGKTVPVDINECVECCTCVSVCPEDAIEHSAC